MSSLNSTSTRAQVRAAIADNASYLEDNSVSKAKALVTALTIWLLNFAPKRAVHGGRGGGEEVELDTEAALQMKKDAERFIASGAGVAAGGAAARHDDFAGFRE